MSTNIRTCPSCGGAVDPNARFCFSCGHDLSSPAPPGAEDSLAPEQGMLPTSAAMNDEGAHAATVSASIGSASEDAMSADVGIEPALDTSTSISTPAASADEPATPAESTSFSDDPAASDVGESSSLSEGYAAFETDVSTTYFAPSSSGSDSLGFDTSVESGQPQTPSTTSPQDDTDGIDSPGTGYDVAGAPADAPGEDSWYNSLSSSPGGSISGDTLRISPVSDSPPGASTVNIGERSEDAASPGSGYAPPPPPVAPDSSATTAAFTPPPAFSSAPMQPPVQGGYTPPPMQQPQGQAFYTPPTQQLQGQQPYMPPPQYNQPPPTTQMQGYSNYQQPTNYQQPIYPASSPYSTAVGKDPTVALLLELIGYAGILGIGHIYAGRTNRGIALLIGWLVYIFAATFLSIICIGCLMFIAWPFVPILSGLWIKNDLEKERAMGMPR